jgi:AraC family transcriptional regulator
MHQPPDILQIAFRQHVMLEQLPLVHEKQSSIPGSVQFHIRRYRHHPQWTIEESGMIIYHFDKKDNRENYLELKFCVTGNTYCRHLQNGCEKCGNQESAFCTEKTETLDILSFRFSPVHLSQFARPRQNNTLSEDVLNFRHRSSFTKILPLCGKSRLVIDGLLNTQFSGSLENIYINAQTQMLLLYSLDCMLGEKETDTISCKFLANDADREKIIKAREILLEHIGNPITIKELSRKVAINECYLKKGFKEMFGTTIFDFYQSQRMEHARYLLYEKGLSVTDVSVMLGYSSISHFSTAFKKHTGLKPCELLR